MRKTSKGGVLYPNGCHGSPGVRDGGANKEAGLDIAGHCRRHKQWSHRLHY